MEEPTSKRIEKLIIEIAKEHNISLPEPSKEVSERVPYAGGLVGSPPKGLVEGISILDFSSFYPNLIISFNLSPETVNIDKTGIEFNFDREGLFPLAIKSLKEKRKDIDQKLLENPDSFELKQEKIALKAEMASFYGLLAYLGFKWHNRLLASKITDLGREILSFAIGKAKEKYSVMYYDTDSIFCQCSKDKGERLARKLTEEVKKYVMVKYRVPDSTLVLRMQEYCERILFFGVSKSYVKLSGDKVGFVGIQRKSMSRFEQRFTEILYEMAVRKIPRSEIEAFIERERANFRRAPLEEIAFRGMVRDAEYKVDTPLVRAVKNSREQFKAGDQIKWLWVKGEPNVVGWDKENPENIVVDWQRMEGLAIDGYVKGLFEVLYLNEKSAQRTLF
jgi:DNA polymerase I